MLYVNDDYMSLVGFIFRKWSNFATKELRKFVVGLSFLWLWAVVDMFTHLVKVRFIVKVGRVVQK